MELIDRSYVESHRDEMTQAILEGLIFIYPTDTIYGLGCNAGIESSVSRIREIKNRDTKPLSVIAPSKSWILDNCVVEKSEVDKYLPGPYTLFVRRRGEVLARSVNSNDDTLGVRIPDHWFSSVVEGAGAPFVTTSVNLSGGEHMESLEEVSEDILEKVDFVVYEGEKKGSSSTKINLVE